MLGILTLKSGSTVLKSKWGLCSFIHAHAAFSDSVLDAEYTAKGLISAGVSGSHAALTESSLNVSKGC